MKEITILEYLSASFALLTVLFVMALISTGNLKMSIGLMIVSLSLAPFFIVSALIRKGRYFLYLGLYVVIGLIFIFLLKR